MCRPMWNACRYSHSRQVCWLRWSCSSVGLNQFASDQYGDDQFAAALSESPGELLFRRQSGCEAEDLLRRLPGIGHDHDVGCGRAVVG